VFDAWDGARPNLVRKRCCLIGHRFRSLVSVSVLAIAIGVSAGCADGESTAPDRLLDGSEAEAPPVDLQSIDDPAVLTKARLLQPGAQDEEERSKSCLRIHDTLRSRGPSVERIGVYSETVTFEESSGRAIFGCDNTPGPREENRRWCGGAYGQLYGGRLRDPRLDIGGCRTGEKEPIAFVWVELAGNARFLAVRQPGFVEVYEAAGNLPIRIATKSGFIADPLGVTIDVTEHDAEGNLLRSRRIEAVPAG
jgi:hypothetical protein